MIYFDNAATSFPKPKEVAISVANAINSFGNASRGFYKISLDASREINIAREEVSKFFSLEKPMNCVFTENITGSINAIIETMIEENDHVITTKFEHNSVLRPLYKKNCDISFIENFDYNILENSSENNLENTLENILEKLLRENTKAIVCTHASNILGDVLNIKEIGGFCRKNNLLFILDVAQTAGVIPINMQEENIDVLMFTGHKSLFGPQGIGGICIGERAEKFAKPYKSGGSGSHSFSKTHPNILPTCYETGTMNTPGISGLLAGLSYINQRGIENIYKYEIELAKMFYDGIKNLENVKVYGNSDFSKYKKCPIISFNIADYNSSDVSLELYENFEIASRSGVHCSPLVHEYMNTQKQGMVRFSFSCFNTKEEIEIGINAIKEICEL